MKEEEAAAAGTTKKRASRKRIGPIANMEEDSDTFSGLRRPMPHQVFWSQFWDDHLQVELDARWKAYETTQKECGGEMADRLTWSLSEVRKLFEDQGDDLKAEVREKLAQWKSSLDLFVEQCKDEYPELNALEGGELAHACDTIKYHK